MDAGSYTTVQFNPELEYTVPPGWSNYEDLPGNFLLLPPGSDIHGVDPGTSDYIGAYSSVAAPLQDCTGRPDPTVGRTATDYVAWLRSAPSFEVSEATPIQVGSRSGTRLEVALSANGGPCRAPGIEFAEFMVGVGPSEFSASVIATVPYRMYLFDEDNGLFAVLVADSQADERADWLSTADDVVRDMSF